MTDADSKVKLDGPYGPMRVSADFPLEAVLKKLGVPYTTKTVAQISREWEEYQRTHPTQIIEEKPLPMPTGFLSLLDHVFADVKIEKEGDE